MASGSVQEGHLFAYELSKLPLWLGKIYPMSRLKSKAAIIHVKSWINADMFLCLLSGSSKSKAVLWGAWAKRGPCALTEGCKHGSRARSGVGVYRQHPTQQVMSQGQRPSLESHQQQTLMRPGTGLETVWNGDLKSIHVRGLGTLLGQGLMVPGWNGARGQWAGLGEAPEEASRGIKASGSPQGPDIGLKNKQTNKTNICTTNSLMLLFINLEV